MMIATFLAAGLLPALPRTARAVEEDEPKPFECDEEGYIRVVPLYHPYMQVGSLVSAIYNPSNDGPVKSRRFGTNTDQFTSASASGYSYDLIEKETGELIAALSAFLKEQKGFSAMKIGRSQRLFYATALAAIDTLLSAPKTEAFAKERDLLQTIMTSGILLFIVTSMAAAAV